MKKKHKTSNGAADWDASPPERLTPLDVQQKEFRVARFWSGYRMRDVDEFLDEVTDTLSALIAENERLLHRSPEGTGVASPAEVRPTTGDADRAAVDAFLRREKGFLQDLGGLVQAHAEELKGMVRSARRDVAATSEAASSHAATSEATPPDAAVSEAANSETASVDAPIEEEPEPVSEPAPAPIEAAEDAPAESEILEEPGDQPGSAPPITEAIAEEPVRLEEPEPARTRRSDDEQEGSLRELFWGEE